jgi:peptide deformylase
MAESSPLERVAPALLPAPILRLGDPRLRQVSAPVVDFAAPVFRENCQRLHATLAAFRRAHGFGRALSAPQIDVPQRFIALDLGPGPRLLVNPEVTWTSQETFTLWDDCMSFPSLLVRVQRHCSISIRYRDERGVPGEWTRLDQAASELVQHESDHLDGVLAVDRALGRDALVLREVFETQRPYFLRQVDYVIGG